MANEAILIVQTGLAIPFSVGNTSGIEKGAILGLVDPRTASGAIVRGMAAAGIAASEKIASDGKTTLGVFREGIFRVLASGAITIGDPCIIEGVNKVGPDNGDTPLSATASGAHYIGTALETAANGETFLIELNPRSVRSGKD